MKKYLLEYGEVSTGVEFNAGSKARNDIFKILTKNGFNPVLLKQEKNKVKKYISIMNIKKNLSIIENESIVVIQFPTNGYKVPNIIISKLKEKKCKLVCIIHDIDSLRFKVCRDKREKDLDILGKFDVIICHNREMEKWLKENKIKNKIVILEVFDYLIEDNESKLNYSKRIKNDEESVVFAGNLSKQKSEFIYKLEEEFLKTIEFNLYGANWESDKSRENLRYHGKFLPDELPLVMNEDYGLIWDGSSLEKCSGESGEYLKYNNPHKLSLYIVAKIPVIVWSESAVSAFVKENNIGIVINSINDIPIEIELNKKNYKQLKNNVEKLASELMRGEYTMKAMREAIEIINK